MTSAGGLDSHAAGPPPVGSAAGRPASRALATGVPQPATPPRLERRHRPPRGRRLRVGPIVRISFGLVALLVSLTLLIELLFDVLPDPDTAQRRVRQRVVENLAAQIVVLLESENPGLLAGTLQQVLAQDVDIRSISVRRADGSLVMRRGPADEPAVGVPTTGGGWLAGSEGGTAGAGGGRRVAAAASDRLRVPVQAGRQFWGEIDVRFAPARAGATGLAAITRRGPGGAPPALLLALLAGGGFALFYLYLRRAMHYLNPSASVPDRVRKAFDALAEGLLIIDQDTQVVLANRAFRRLHPQADGELNGQRIGALDWLRVDADAMAGRDGEGRAPKSADEAPWLRTLRSAEAVNGWPLAVAQPDGTAKRLMVSSAPVTDDQGRTRGCLITFDNVTAIHAANEELRSTLGALEKSRQRIEEQNGELRRLASRDPLTGCLNRRAFFDAAIDPFDAARRAQTPLCCLMADIDHFKQFNDRYGHAVGDQVIQVVARALAAGLRQSDVLCRYGGEEFCIVLPGATPQVALEVAERIRENIESHAAGAIRSTEVVTITSSFGVASLALGARSLEELIDHADQALYQSKQAGRNRVTQWQRPQN